MIFLHDYGGALFKVLKKTCGVENTQGSTCPTRKLSGLKFTSNHQIAIVPLFVFLLLRFYIAFGL